MSPFSVFLVSSTLVSGVLAGSGLASAGALKQTRVAWGYDAVPTKDFNCASSCFGDVGIYHLGTGTYEVEMARIYLPYPSDLQVSSAENPTLAYCTTAGWNHGSGKIVDAFVNCYDIGGNPTDTYFTFLYQSRSLPFGSAEKGIAFLWADQPTESSYTPNLAYQYDSTGATNTMVRNGTGSYTASIPGLTKKGGSVQVTAYGTVPARCKVSSWSSDQSGTSVNVLCFDITGAAADEMFTLAYTIGEPLALWKTNSSYGDVGAHVWANKAHDTDVYTPPRAYNYNGFKTGPLTAQKNSTGTYTVSIPDKNSFFALSTEIVTAYGSTNSFCTAGDGLEDWYPLQVFCYDQNGNPVDSQFSVVLQTPAKN